MAFLLWHYLTESAEQHPGRPALAWGDRVLTYRELDDRTARVAALLNREGVGAGQVVALFAPKTADAVVAMLGIARTGATYVPIDPNAPAQRAAQIVENCTARAVVTEPGKLQQLIDILGETNPLELALLIGPESNDTPGYGLEIRAWREIGGTDPLPSDRGVASETDPAYLLYTSGSTGTPKGVTISHRNAMAFVEWGAETFDVRHEDRLSNHAPLHFDLSVFDIYVALSVGACVDLIPAEVAPFPVQLAEWIERRGITVWYSVPSALTRLLIHGNLDRFDYEHLRCILYAGEPFPVKHLRKVMERFPNTRFYNLYGPTETNVCTYHPLPSRLAPETDEIPIGRACANTVVFAVTDEGRLADPGEEGELWVRGPTVMLGYWGMPEKSATVLTRNPFQSSYEERVYRTGDIVKLDEAGRYTFVGRRDHMVKSRGYRIELGEIETALYKHEAVKEAAAVALPDEEVGSTIHAVITPKKDRVLTSREVQTFCMGHLPRYMVPETIVITEESLPRTSTGKIDRMTLQDQIENFQSRETPTG